MARRSTAALGLVALLVFGACASDYGAATESPPSSPNPDPTDGTSLPAASIDDIALAEGSVGTTSFVFTVTLSKPSSDTVTIAYATSNGTATPPSDYETNVGTLVFPPNVVVQTVSIAVKTDSAREEDETFSLVLSNPVNATLAKDKGTATILNDDTVPEITVAPVSTTEGSPLVFTLTLSSRSTESVSVDWNIVDVTTTAADRSAVTTGTVTFGPGSTTRTVEVATASDSLDEGDETLDLALSNASGATVGPPAAGTILDDDPTPVLTMTGPAATLEGTLGVAKPVSFQVTLSAASGRVVTVHYATQDGTATSGGNAPDYTATNGTLTIQPGQLGQTIEVVIHGDNTHELDESFYVVLSSATNATIGTPLAGATIANDD